MRMSALAEATGLPVATVKFYLREGLVPPGRALSRTQAEYDDAHVERVRLVRALTEVGGLSLAAVRRALDAIDRPEPTRVGVMGTAQEALAEGEPEVGGAAYERAERFLADRGWCIEGNPFVGQLARAWAACEEAGLGLDEARLGRYADAAEIAAAVDVGSVPDDPQGAVRQVVLGTVLVDPVLAALRRLAQQHVALTARGAGRRPR